MLRRMLLRWFWNSYDGVLPLALANVLLAIPAGILVYGYLAALQVFDGAVIPSAITTALWGGLLLPGFAAVCAAILLPAAQRVATEEPTFTRRALRADLRKLPRLLAFHIMIGLFTGALAVTVWFYLFSGQIPESASHMAKVIGGLCLWALILPMGMLLHGAPLVVFNDVRPLRALVLSLGMVFAFPGLTASALMVLALLTIVGASFAFTGLILFGGAGTAVMSHALFTVISARVEQGLHTPPPDEDARDEPRYERTLRDIIRPWN